MGELKLKGLDRLLELVGQKSVVLTIGKRVNNMVYVGAVNVMIYANTAKSAESGINDILNTIDPERKH